jgi:hypothetical protein
MKWSGVDAGLGIHGWDFGNGAGVEGLVFFGGAEAAGLGAEEEEHGLVDFGLLVLGIGAIEAGIDAVQGWFVAVEGGGARPGLARFGTDHYSILSTTDCAVPNDLFLLDFFWTVQFRRALWCQEFWKKIFRKEIFELKRQPEISVRA